MIDPHSGLPRAPWAYGPGGRMLVGFVLVYHITAIAFWELPEKDCLSTFRVKGREAFTTWVLTTQTDIATLAADAQKKATEVISAAA